MAPVWSGFFKIPKILTHFFKIPHFIGKVRVLILALLSFVFQPLSGAYGLARHRDGSWEWAVAPGVSPSARYQHAAVFVNARLHVSGGALGGGRMVEDSSSVAVLDTTAGVWCDRRAVVAAPRPGRFSADAPGGEASTELTRRCRHAAAAVGEKIFAYGGLRGGVLLEDLLLAEDSSPPPASRASLPVEVSQPVGPEEEEDSGERSQHREASEVDGEKLKSISSEEAMAAKAALEAARKKSEEGDKSGETPVEPPQSPTIIRPVAAQTSPPSGSLGSQSDPRSTGNAPGFTTPGVGVRLHHRAVVVAAESGGALGGLVRQLSLDQFENEGRRVSYGTPESVKLRNRLLDRQVSMQGIHKKVIAYLLKPRGWKPPAKRDFFLEAGDIAELCDAAEAIFKAEQTVLKLRAPLKIFGDLHGQFGDLMRLFDEYGAPSTAGDITYIDYLFLGDYVDRGQHSLETIILLLALKIENPGSIHLIRGNHEAADINALFGFRIECIERMGEESGIWAWQRINTLFNWLPLAALIENKIVCMHGGIGRSIETVEQIEALQRPITMEAGSMVLMDLLW